MFTPLKTKTEKYSKLWIHYSNTKCAEINVYADSDSIKLSEEFCQKYNLASSMKDQLKTIIEKKI